MSEATATKAEFGIERSKDLPWNEKKITVFKALKSLKAVGVKQAVSVGAVAQKAGLSARDVRHYVYHAKAAGLTGVGTSEEVKGHTVYLTTKGDKIDLSKVMGSGK